MTTWKVTTVCGLTGRGQGEIEISANSIKVGDSGSLEFFADTKVPISEYPYADEDDIKRGYVPGEVLVASFAAGNWVKVFKVNT